MRKNYPDTSKNGPLFFVFLLFLLINNSFGQTCTDYTVNPSINIPDNTSTYTVVDITVADSYTLVDVNVLVDITHTWNSDVDMFLRHPDGTFVELFTDIGGSGNDFSNVTFDDEAASVPPGGTVNLSGSYQPEGDLSTLDGKNSAGTWSLYIRDDAGGDLGVLNTFRLNLCQTTVVVDPCTNGAIVGTPTANDPDGDGINNECDLDDDNDGITDTEEYCTNATTALLPSTNASGDRQVTVNHTDTGFARLDLTELDNSFQMTVNGTPVHPSILEFENGALGGGEVYFRFQSDNAFISSPWNPNVNGLPRLRLTIDETGTITLLGSRTTTSTTLEPMVAQDGTPFNTITWTPLANNTFIIINQTGPGPEELQGSLLASNICDTDGDGISNELDLDSDNDGIYDIVESGVLAVGGVADANNDGVVDGASTGSGANGLFNAVETNDTFGASLSYTVLDSDSDGETNPFEVDSDADGCFDAIEAAGSFVAADLTSGRLCTSSACVNANGVPTNAGSPQATTTAVTIGDVISSIPITPSPASVCEGSNITLTAAPVGVRNSAGAIPAGDYIYTWYLGASSTPLPNSPPYSGTNTASLTITNATTALSGNSYRVEVTTINNSCIEQNNISITVQAQPASAGTNGTLEVCPGDTPTTAQLFGALGGSPAGGGVWSNVGLVYTYTQAATNPCTTDNTATVTVTEVDTTNPTISSCPADVTVNVDAGTCTASGVSLGTAPTGTDNCGTPTITNNAPATFPIGATTVTWTSTDAAGNTATCTQTVTVVDNINPTISSCPADVTVNVDAGTCTASGV
ncbi:proprotein convertase P-domain-containing protein, partial [Tenacibaculum aiptasiae]|uniref:proprotein convertase P-domain-containing protein n=1 Tax=Tenacibaculum aiptasiae TaxID=426481 RepID=UPI00232BC4C2